MAGGLMKMAQIQAAHSSQREWRRAWTASRLMGRLRKPLCGLFGRSTLARQGAEACYNTPSAHIVARQA